MEHVAVIGLGQMGATLATLLLGAGMPVHVWNRTPARTDSLARAGAIATDRAAGAIEHARIVVVCVADYAASIDIFSDTAVLGALKDKIVIQLTTGSADEARALQAIVSDAGGGYLDGAIQVAPEQMGQPDTTILVSGNQASYAGCRAVLGALGGNIVYLGSDIAAAAVMDLATLSYIYGASIGFFHGAALAQAEGLDVAAYGRIADAMSPPLGTFLRHEGNAIDTGDFTVTQSPLAISVPATERIAHAMRGQGIHADFSDLIARLVRETADAGYARHEFAAVVKVLTAGRTAAALNEAA